MRIWNIDSGSLEVLIYKVRTIGCFLAWELNYYVQVTAQNSPGLSLVGNSIPIGQTVNVTALLQIGQMRQTWGHIYAEPFASRVARCATDSGLDLTKNLTGISTLNDIGDSLSSGSIAPLISVQNELDVTEHAGEIATKIVSGTAGRVMEGVGKLAGRTGTALSAAQAALEFKKCMGR